jgi:hypothetical protein
VREGFQRRPRFDAFRATPACIRRRKVKDEFRKRSRRSGTAGSRESFECRDTARRKRRRRVRHSPRTNRIFALRRCGIQVERRDTSHELREESLQLLVPTRTAPDVSLRHRRLIRFASP